MRDRLIALGVITVLVILAARRSRVGAASPRLTVSQNDLGFSFSCLIKIPKLNACVVPTLSLKFV